MKDIHTIFYKPVPENANLHIWVTELPMQNEPVRYRVELFIANTPHSLQITDLRLRRESHRRWLERYAEVHGVTAVYFGDGLSENNYHYKLDAYIRRSIYNLDFLKDLKVPPFN